MKTLLVITVVLFPFLAGAQQKAETSGREDGEKAKQFQKVKEEVAALKKEIAELEREIAALEKSALSGISLNGAMIMPEFIASNPNMLVKPEFNSYYSGIVITPDPEIDYTGILIDPDPNIDYRGIVIPEEIIVR